MRTAEPLRAIAGGRSVVGVEHDMEFVRDAGLQGHGAASGAGAGRVPGVRFSDDPAEGIQPSITKDGGRAIAYLRKKANMAIVLVDKCFEFARDLADDFVLMDCGEIVMGGSRAEIVEADVQRHLTV